jgi:hypothetical protein
LQRTAADCAEAFKLMPTRLQLKEGVGPQAAATVVRALVMAARNVPSASGGGRSSALRDAYLNWAETAESQLSGLTHDAAVVTMLQTPRFWQIRALDEPSTRPWPLIDAEIRLQTTVLERLADDLDERVRRPGSAAGHLTSSIRTSCSSICRRTEFPGPKRSDIRKCA